MPKFDRSARRARTSGVERFIPFRSHYPRESRHPPAEQAPFEIVPPEILPTVLGFDSLGGLNRLPQNRLLLFGQWLLAALDLLKPNLVPVPPHFVPQFVVGLQYGFVVAPQKKGPLFLRIIVIWNPFDLVTGLCVA